MWANSQQRTLRASRLLKRPSLRDFRTRRLAYPHFSANTTLRNKVPYQPLRESRATSAPPHRWHLRQATIWSDATSFITAGTNTRTAVRACDVALRDGVTPRPSSTQTWSATRKRNMRKRKACLYVCTRACNRRSLVFHFHLGTI